MNLTVNPSMNSTMNPSMNSPLNPSLPSAGYSGPGHQPAVRLAFALLLALGLAACAGTSESGPEGAEGSGEGPEGPEGGSGEGREGSEGAGSGDGGEGAQYDLTHTYDMVESNGARLVLRYDAANERFTGTVTNTTGATLTDVRVEIHLGPNRSETNEIGPTPWRDLAPGEIMLVSLGAAGRNFSRYGVHVESGPQDDPNTLADPVSSSFAPPLGPWAVMGGVELGLENQGHGLEVWYTRQGNAWTPHLSPNPAPEHQPTGAATWTGEWVGYQGTDPMIDTGAARVTVTLGTGAPEAALTLDDVPTLGTLQWDAMPVTGGRFSGTATANAQRYDATGQFGGTGQAGVAGYATGPDFRSVFYGEKP